MSDPKTILDATLTVVLAGGDGKRLLPLTEDRPKSALPIGGPFKLIDFTLSNCFNSGLRRLFLLTQYKSEALHCYICKSSRVKIRNLSSYFQAIMFIAWTTPNCWNVTPIPERRSLSHKSVSPQNEGAGS